MCINSFATRKKGTFTIVEYIYDIFIFTAQQKNMTLVMIDSKLTDGGKKMSDMTQRKASRYVSTNIFELANGSCLEQKFQLFPWIFLVSNNMEARRLKRNTSSDFVNTNPLTLKLLIR